jgi:hypothetical protein
VLETDLTEVKHQGELKLQHLEPIGRGRLWHIMMHRKNTWATAHPLACQALAQQALQASTNCHAWPTHCRPTRTPTLSHGSMPHWTPTPPFPHKPSGPPPRQNSAPTHDPSWPNRPPLHWPPDCPSPPAG